ARGILGGPAAAVWPRARGPAASAGVRTAPRRARHRAGHGWPDRAGAAARGRPRAWPRAAAPGGRRETAALRWRVHAPAASAAPAPEWAATGRSAGRGATVPP